MGLITSRPRSAASARAWLDHGAQVRSSVRMSRRTLLSTKVTRPGCRLSVTTRERHDLVRGHGDVASTPQTGHEPLAPAPTAHRATDHHSVTISVEVDLGARQDAQLVAQVLGNRHLALVRHHHGRNPTIPTLTDRVTRESVRGDAWVAWGAASAAAASECGKIRA